MKSSSRKIFREIDFTEKKLTVSVGEGDPFDPFNLSMACSGGDSRDPEGK